MKLTCLVALGIAGAMVCGCDPVGKTVFEFRVTDAGTSEPVVGACVYTDRISNLPPDPIVQGNTDSDGRVTAVHLFVLNPLTLQPSRFPLLVRIDDGATLENIEVEWETGAIGTGDVFEAELISFTSDRDLDDAPERGCDG